MFTLENPIYSLTVLYAALEGIFQGIIEILKRISIETFHFAFQRTEKVLIKFN